MNSGKYVFSQITDFLPKRYFERLVLTIWGSLYIKFQDLGTKRIDCIMIDQTYLNQADLLLQVIPHIAANKTLALKGEAAINLFLHYVPRLSVDIDLTYLPFENRENALINISGALRRIIWQEVSSKNDLLEFGL